VIRAELAAVRWGPVAGALAAGAGLAVLDLTVWPRGPGSELCALVAGLLGGSAALALDDPAAGVTAAAPTTRRRRTAVRLVVAAVVVGVWCGYVGWVVSALRADGIDTSWLTLVAIGTGVVALCTGVAVDLGREGDAQPGSAVAATAVIGMLGLMVLPLPGDLAPYDASSRWTDATALWTVLGGVGLAALWRGSADPWRRRPGQRRTAAIVSRYQP
jgi:hypothetical protein